MDKLVKLTRTEMDEVEAIAQERFESEILGGRPTYKTVEKNLPNDNSVTIMEKVTIPLLLAIFLFTAFKVLTPAFEFADSFLGVPELWRGVFRWSTATVLILLSTTGLIYTKMQASDPHVLRLQRQNRIGWNNFWRFEVLTPRMGTYLTYAVAIWLFIISSRGEGDWFIKYLPVVFEVYLASLVSTTLEKRRERIRIVSAAWVAQAQVFDAQLTDSHTDPRYLTVLYQELREGLTPTRFGKSRRNAWLLDVDATVELSVIAGEYKRLSAGLKFAEVVGGKALEDAKKTKALKKTNQSITEHSAVVEPLRTPLHGMGKWTVATLTDSFKQNGHQRQHSFTESDLRKRYAMTPYATRKAWRAGAKFYFDAYTPDEEGN